MSRETFGSCNDLQPQRIVLSQKVGLRTITYMRLSRLLDAHIGVIERRGSRELWRAFRLAAIDKIFLYEGDPSKCAERLTIECKRHIV